MFHSNRVQKEKTLHHLIEELYLYQSKIDLTNGMAHSQKIQNINQVGSASFYTACIWAITSVVMDWKLGYCEPRIQRIDKDNNVIGEMRNNEMWIDGLNYWMRRGQIGTRLAYDYNGNGIFGEKGETETCQWLQNNNKLILYFFFGMLVISGMCKLYSWNSERVYRNNLNAKKDYDDLYEEINETLIRLVDNFDSLSVDQQQAMVDLGLASKDSKNVITLKYICPISLGLIVMPVVIETDHHQTVYDLKSLLPHIKINFKDPSTMLAIKHLGFSTEMNNQYKQYLQKAESFINIAMQENLNKEKNCSVSNIS